MISTAAALEGFSSSRLNSCLSRKRERKDTEAARTYLEHCSETLNERKLTRNELRRWMLAQDDEAHVS